MKRISNEDGVNAGARNFGRLMLALIPYALGLGAAIWLGTWIGIHNFRHQLSQEERAAIYTGAEQRPKSKILIEAQQSGCIQITRADFEGSTLMLYAKNNCTGPHRDYLEYHWATISPNGTIVHEGYTNSCSVPMQPGDSAECIFNEDAWNSVTIDTRTAKLRVWLGRQ